MNTSKDDLIALLRTAEKEFAWCESHWGSDYTALRYRLQSAIAGLGSALEQPRRTVPCKITNVQTHGVTVSGPHGLHTIAPGETWVGETWEVQQGETTGG